MQRVIILRGLPGSGKSTWARERVDKGNGMWKRINRDMLRDMLDNWKWSFDREIFTISIRDTLIYETLENGYNVIVDDTNLGDEHVKDILKVVKFYMKENNVVVHPVLKFFDVPIEECIKRDLQRPLSVGEKVIRDMYNKYLRKEDKEINASVSSVLPQAIICDIDGTLAHMKNRGPFEWHRVGEDMPNTTIINLLIQLFHDATHPRRVILFSGRDSVCKAETIKWLNDYSVPFHELHMRAEGDMRKDSIIKKELYNKFVKGKYNVNFVLDDRNQVVEMWRNELGLTCLQVAEGNF